MSRANNISIFENTNLIANTRYPYLEQYTKLNNFPELAPFMDKNYIIYVTKNNCMVDARNSYGKTMMVSSASLNTKGGGVLNGSNAQEESICRCSNLYMALGQIDQEIGYPLHGKLKGAFFPQVTFFKDEYYQKCQPFTVDIMALFSRPEKTILTYEYHIDAFKPLFYFSNVHKIETLVLVPIGCGVFKNDPVKVAGALKKLLHTFQLQTVKTIYISCYNDKNNYRIFKNTLCVDKGSLKSV